VFAQPIAVLALANSRPLYKPPFLRKELLAHLVVNPMSLKKRLQKHNFDIIGPPYKGSTGRSEVTLVLINHH
jgi:hypothetical protein